MSLLFPKRRLNQMINVGLLLALLPFALVYLLDPEWLMRALGNSMLYLAFLALVVAILIAPRSEIRLVDQYQEKYGDLFFWGTKVLGLFFLAFILYSSLPSLVHNVSVILNSTRIQVVEGVLERKDLNLSSRLFEHTLVIENEGGDTLRLSYKYPTQRGLEVGKKYVFQIAPETNDVLMIRDKEL